MDIHAEDGLDKLLRSRAMPEIPEGLAEQIVAAAARQPQITVVSTAGRHLPWYVDLVQAMLLPKPAFAFAALLLFGLMIGLDLGAVPDDAGLSDWSNLFSSGEGLL